MALSITTAWDEARRFVAREAALLIPIGLTLMVVPGALAELALPQNAAEAATSNLWLLSMAIIGLFTLVGSLATVRLAMGGGVSVGEALTAAMRRLPVALGANLLPAFVAAIALLPVVRTIPTPGGPAVGPVSPALQLYMLVLVAAVFYFSVRLLLLNVVVMREPTGVIAALKRSFAVTRGHVGKLAGVMLLFGASLLIISGAVSLAGGAVLVGGGRLLGFEPIGKLLLALLTGAVNATLSIYFAATLTMIYRQLAGQGASGGIE
ncbi:hypothetical protein ACFB49_08800 [Sphingomonas sp. DBB INV C78]|uniref:hypothetical protein n=1 Tax=Sphingomonas sp. DBB INV C78 TaxID=3349434 RepID=UPI0036D2676C